MVEVGRAVCVPQAQALLQQGHPEQGAQDHVQATLEDLQEGDPTATCANAPSPSDYVRQRCRNF